MSSNRVGSSLLYQEVVEPAKFERAFTHGLEGLEVCGILGAFEELAVVVDLEDDGGGLVAAQDNLGLAVLLGCCGARLMA